MKLDPSLGLKLDYSAEAPLFLQIAEAISQRVGNGLYPAGFRLPPTRQLAEALDVHRNTVVRAFDELTARGLIESTVGRGTFVTARGGTQPGAEAAASGIVWATLLSKRLDSAPLARAERLSRAMNRPQAIQLQRMQPSPDLLPVEALRRCSDHVLRSQGARVLGYAPREGHAGLREAIAATLGAGGLPVRADEIVVTSGSQQALDLVARALVDPGDPVLLETPTYTGAINLFSAHGGVLVGVPGDEHGPDLAALERLGGARAKFFYVIPNARNPTGGTMIASRRDALVRWSSRSGTPLVEDDYGADLDLDGVPPPIALRALDADVLHLGTYSKRLIPALRVGYLVCPPALRDRIVALKHAADLGASLFLQSTLAEFLSRGYLRKHLLRVLPEYRARRDALEATLKAHLSKEIRWRHVDRGVTLWLELPDGLDAEAAFLAAAERGVLTSPGVLSSVGEQGARGLRVTFCAEPVPRVREGAKRLAKALDEALKAKTKTRSAHGMI